MTLNTAGILGSKLKALSPLSVGGSLSQVGNTLPTRGMGAVRCVGKVLPTYDKPAMPGALRGTTTNGERVIFKVSIPRLQ